MASQTIFRSEQNARLNAIDFGSIRARHPLPEYCQKRGIELHRSGSSGELVGLCPLHPEKTASFHVYPDNHYHCYGCGAHGDVTDLEQALGGGTRTEAADRLGAERWENVGKLPKASEPKTPAERRPLLLPEFSIPNEIDLRRLSRLRSISIVALQIAVSRGFLWTYTDSREGRAWLVTDRARRLAIARRLDGKPWEYRNGEFVANPAERSKTKNIFGSQGNWPLGILESKPTPAIALVEGAPDFLSAFQLALSAGVTGETTPVCISGASQRIPQEALPLFAGKRVRVFGHDDTAGAKAMTRWAEQLSAVQAKVDGFYFHGLVKADGSPVKDVNDFLRADHRRSGCPIDVVTGAFDFALERRVTN